MTENKFKEFWNKWSEYWMDSTIKLETEEVLIKDLCTIKEDYGHILYKRYEAIKEIIKQSYFKDVTKKLSRYKRAAVVAYAINSSNPLIYVDENIKKDISPYFLKQRLAFYVALGSILQDYPQNEIEEKGLNVFDFENLGVKYSTEGEDSFLQSVYKDLLYSEIYDNYNVLTMANVFGLLVERASKLSDVTPL